MDVNSRETGLDWGQIVRYVAQRWAYIRTSDYHISDTTKTSKLLT